MLPKSRRRANILNQSFRKGYRKLGAAKRPTVAGTLIVMPMVLHAVGSEGFGVWAAAASFFWMTVVVDFGVGQALLTNVAQNVARGDIAEIRRQIGAALLVSLVLAFVRTLLAITIIPRVTSPREDCGRS